MTTGLDYTVNRPLNCSQSGPISKDRFALHEAFSPDNIAPGLFLFANPYAVIMWGFEEEEFSFPSELREEGV